MDTDSLKLIGLAQNDYKVYESALKGSFSISQICHDTGVHRRNVYDCINRLLKFGLLSFYEQNKKRVYIASPPEKIIAGRFMMKAQKASNTQRILCLKLGIFQMRVAAMLP